AAATKNPEQKKIFLMLAEEEQRHYRIFKNLKEGQLGTAKEFAANRAKTVSITKNLFQKIAEEGKNSLFGDDTRALWKEAIGIEEKSEKMYREAAAKEKDPERKKLFNKIADEEKNHIYLIDNMLSFMSDPQTFIESNQFASFKSWEGH
ncbi:MAG: ferritin family protein, partial [candidate division Zixibacteria bacterium]|nr:ferritin family protein [candidate division Zixibacteria bacterium]